MVVQSSEGSQGLNDGEEGNILQMESGQMVSSSVFSINEHLSIQPIP